MSNRLYSKNMKQEPQRISVVPHAPSYVPPSNVIRLPSGVNLEHTPRKPRSLWPLAILTLLLWSCVAGAVWTIIKNW